MSLGWKFPPQRTKQNKTTQTQLLMSGIFIWWQQLCFYYTMSTVQFPWTQLNSFFLWTQHVWQCRNKGRSFEDKYFAANDDVTDNKYYFCWDLGGKLMHFLLIHFIPRETWRRTTLFKSSTITPIPKQTQTTGLNTERAADSAAERYHYSVPVFWWIHFY